MVPAFVVIPDREYIEYIDWGTLIVGTNLGLGVLLLIPQHLFRTGVDLSKYDKPAIFKLSQ